MGGYRFELSPAVDFEYVPFVKGAKTGFPSDEPFSFFVDGYSAAYGRREEQQIIASFLGFVSVEVGEPISCRVDSAKAQYAFRVRVLRRE